jgi:3,4-dihydroxy 2-butanone 4-phosphate synthase / GTP cyclohydrolase II
MPALSQALDHLRRGGMVVLVDDEDRENEGDLVLAAEFATPESINFMLTHARGLVCLALTGKQVDRLNLPPMTGTNRTQRSTAFTISIEARDGITTGISAAERALTIRTAARSDATADDIVSPGHVFPLRAVDGGVLKRNGHTEGAVDLMTLAGLTPAGVICEIMRDSGEMMRRDELDGFARTHDLPILTIQELVQHRLITETLVEEVASAALPTAFGGDGLRVKAFRSLIDGVEHLAVVKQPFPDVPLVRVHSECLTGDVLGSLRCDCGPQAQEALRLISGSEGGALIYVRGHEGRGIGLANKIRAYALQDEGLDTVEANKALGFPADARDYAVAAQIIKALGISKLALLSNNPAKARALERFGITVANQHPLLIAANPHNATYLRTKQNSFGHMIFS